MKSVGFPPIARLDAKLLVLGSLPGRMSLEKREYYAQPQNAFWPIMGALFGAGRELPYAERTQALIDRKVAIWDVCAVGFRPGSLDSAIELATVKFNDFAAFFHTHRYIQRIGFNGAKAAELYEGHVLPLLPAPVQAIARMRLPSTSPAHAGMRLERKLECWRTALHFRGDTQPGRE